MCLTYQAYNHYMKTTKVHSFNKSHVQTLITIRKSDGHKGTFGSVAIIGGDAGMVGAVLLSARAALYSGVFDSQGGHQFNESQCIVM